jgi:hypothetical protein
MIKTSIVSKKLEIDYIFYEIKEFMIILWYYSDDNVMKMKRKTIITKTMSTIKWKHCNCMFHVQELKNVFDKFLQRNQLYNKNKTMSTIN